MFFVLKNDYYVNIGCVGCTRVSAAMAGNSKFLTLVVKSSVLSLGLTNISWFPSLGEGDAHGRLSEVSSNGHCNILCLHVDVCGLQDFSLYIRHRLAQGPPVREWYQLIVFLCRNYLS